ncbi:MAG: hypothetical protein PF569_05220 [Candidatus Woesearchaeota archaeon]|jgi:hypothetical protein|nr:hypothetical protein [Candidatus Woesearchaeota archaeon]
MEIINNILKFDLIKIVQSKMHSIASQFNQRLMCAKNISFLSMSKNFFEIFALSEVAQKW